MNQSLLSLGDMLTFIGLIIAAMQLVKTRYLLIWKLTRSSFKATAVGLMVIGYLLPLASVFVPDTKKYFNGLTLDQLLQVASFSVITLGLLIVVLIYSPLNYRHLLTVVPKIRFHINRYPKKKWKRLDIAVERDKKVTTRSAKKFYIVTSIFLARGKTEEVVEITRVNMKSLVHSASQYSPDHFRLPDEPDPEPTKPSGSIYSFEMLYQLLTDQAVMKYICTNNRIFLHNIVDLEINGGRRSFSSEFASVLYPSLVEHLVLNTDSFLYTQKDANSGIARFANVYDLLTDERIVRRQNIVPTMLTWSVRKANVPLDEYVDVLLALLERMVDNYKEQPGNGELLTNIRRLYDELIGDHGVTRHLAYDQKARKHYAEDLTGSMAHKVLSKIESAMPTSLLFSDDDPDVFKTNAAELKAENTSSTYEQKTFTGLMAHKVYELIEDLTVFYGASDDSDGDTLREVYQYLTVDSDSSVAKRYRKLLWDMLFDKAIDGKLERYPTNMAGYYPNVLRLMINYLVPFDEYRTKRHGAAIKRLKHLMSHELKEALLNEKKMSNDKPMVEVLLPTILEAKINKRMKTVQYFYVDGRGKKTELDLSEQDTDSPSAVQTK